MVRILSLVHARWRVIALDTPTVWRRCSGCRRRQPLRCSEKFRVNANKNRLDIWLIYRCTHCDASWNYPVVERCGKDSVAPALLEASTVNDKDVAWQYAFDVHRLRRFTDRVDAKVAFRIDKRILGAGFADPPQARIEISLGFPCEIRLEKFLSASLSSKRCEIRTLYRRGALRVLPAPAELKKSICDGQSILLDLSRFPLPIDLLGPPLD